MTMTDTQQAELDQLKDQLVEACRVGDTELVDSLIGEITDLVSDLDSDDVSPNKPIEWNEDPQWIEYSFTFETEVKKIAAKFTTDEALREDCEQEARVALLTIFPENLHLYKRFQAGEIDEATWLKQLDRYCRNAIRNSVLSYLDSMKTGNWYIGRTRRVRDRVTGERMKTHVGPRYSSMDELVEEAGLQVDSEGNVTWDRIGTDGLDTKDGANDTTAWPVHPNHRHLDPLLPGA